MGEKIIFIRVLFTNTLKNQTVQALLVTLLGHNLPTPFQEILVRPEPVIFLCLMFTVIPTSSSK